jgi:hypothetical protein
MVKIDKQLVSNIKLHETYNLSDTWENIRLRRLEIDNFKCVLCKSNKKLVCHHLTYKRIYRESMVDVITLCNQCHNRIHLMCPPKNVPDFVKKSAIFNVVKFSTRDIKEAYKGVDF